MTFLFAINPVSGGNSKTDWEVGIHNEFTNSPHEAELLHLDGKTDEDALKKKIAELKPDRVVAVGGDGTIKCVAGQLLGTGIPLGILPAGSANGMARELGIPTDIQGSLTVIINGVLKPTDVISIEDGDICLHLGDIGLNAQMVKYYQNNNLRGKFGYLKSALNVFRERQFLTAEITIGDECIQRTAFMIVLANARMYGNGAVINPNGNIFDGKFEVVICRQLSFWEIVKLFWQYRPFDPTKVEIYPATSVTIKTIKRAYFQVDGEYQGRVTTLKAKIRAGALTMIVPE